MRRIGFALTAMVLLLVWTACGGGSSSTPSASSSPNGNWSAVATSAGGQQVDAFQFTMTQGGMMSGGNMMMNMSNLQFTVGTNCFGAGTTMTGQMSGSMMGSSQMSMDMWSGPGQTGNHLHMDMAMNSAFTSATGTYTLTGVSGGCTSSSGPFTMTRMS